MNRSIRAIVIAALALAGMAGFGSVTSCNIIGGGSGGPTGGLNVLVTDGPTDDWQQVTIILRSISLHSSSSNSWKDVWTADAANPAAGAVNLVDLDGVAAILKTAAIPVGTYDVLKFVMDTDPHSMTLITDDGATIDPRNITVVDPSGKGEIKVDLSEPIDVVEGQETALLMDFDLAHPLAIVNLDGKVVISLKVRHKRLPVRLNALPFARTIGDVKAVADDLKTITLTTLREDDVVFNVNANTTYIDVDAKATGTLEGLKALVGSGAALVASNMNADGSLYARRVWYAAAIETLPQFTPEGLVRRVGDNWLSVMKRRTEPLSAGDRRYRCDWSSETIFVDADTAWTFRDNPMGTGTSILTYISRGFRVEVTLVDENASPKVAASINVQSAHAEGVLAAATTESFTLGWFRNTRTMVYSDIPEHGFGWLFYGMVDASRSTVVGDLVEAVDQARAANLWVFARAGLYWDGGQTRWEVENLVLAPLKLVDPTKITTGYTAAAGTMGVSTFDCWDWTTPLDMTIALDTTGDLQTVVGSFVWNAPASLATFTLPVLPAEWEELLTPAVDRVKIWVRPVKTDATWSWHAYSVIAYQFIP